MRNDMIGHPLIAWANRPQVKQLSGFVAMCEQLTNDELVVCYQAELRAAPHRALAGKQYLSAARRGIPHTTAATNRGEEQLAFAIFNRYWDVPMALPSGEELRVIDYQFPLKASHRDRGVGKIDLLALTATGYAAVIELKAAGGHDTPLRAVLEGLAYVAILQANLATLQAEVQQQLEVPLRDAVPRLLIMAPDAYWSRFSTHPASRGWQTALRTVCRRIAESVGVLVSCLALGTATFTYGSTSRPSTLQEPLTLRDVLGVR